MIHPVTSVSPCPSPPHDLAAHTAPGVHRQSRIHLVYTEAAALIRVIPGKRTSYSYATQFSSTGRPKVSTRRWTFLDVTSSLS